MLETRGRTHRRAEEPAGGSDRQRRNVTAYGKQGARARSRADAGKWDKALKRNDDAHFWVSGTGNAGDEQGWDNKGQAVKDVSKQDLPKDYLFRG